MVLTFQSSLWGILCLRAYRNQSKSHKGLYLQAKHPSAFHLLPAYI